MIISIISINYGKIVLTEVNCGQVSYAVWKNVNYYNLLVKYGKGSMAKIIVFADYSVF